MNFQEFILENYIVELINENSIMASGGFLDKLSAMAKKNKIAKILYELFDGEAYVSGDLAQNWIDVAGEDTVSFMGDTKANKLNWSEETPYVAKGRTIIKVGRLVNALLSNPSIKSEIENYIDDTFELKSKDIEEFVNLYKSTNVDTTKKFKLVKGDDIAKWYDVEKYANSRGTLGSSCMREVDSDYFDIYSHNEKACRLLIFINGEKELLGRALVWKLEVSPCEAKYFMDRVYVSNDSDFLKFKEFAIEQGWMYKNRNSSDSNEALLFRYNENPVFGKIVVKLKEGNFKQYPFVDTLSFLDKKKETLSNIGSMNCYVLSSTSGEREFCNTCAGKGKDGCNYCDDDGTITCGNCDGEGSTECSTCEGKGTTGKGKSKANCTDCGGDGVIECSSCKGGGTESCPKCHGNTDCPECIGIEYATKTMIKEGDAWKDYKYII